MRRLALSGTYRISLWICDNRQCPHSSSSENLCFSLFSIRFCLDLGVGPPQDLVPQQEGGTLGLTHSCFVLDDGGGWTLNRPLPESNGWNASSCFPTPGR